MDLGFELERGESAARYVWKRRGELPIEGWEPALQAAIETGHALEGCQLSRARTAWRRVLAAAVRESRSARRSGISPRRLAGRIERLRDAVDLVLFDGRLPPDQAALAARTAAKMCARALEHALIAYWEDGPVAPTPGRPGPATTQTCC